MPQTIIPLELTLAIVQAYFVVVPRRPHIAIIGPGKVGLALAALAARAGYDATLGARNVRQSRSRARRVLPGAKVATASYAAAAGDVVLLTVSDSSIKAVCDELAQSGSLRSGSIVAHCCGALGSEVLASADRCGCRVASMHPLQTFPSAQAAIAAMPGTFFFCEGDSRALRALRTIVRNIGGRPIGLAKFLDEAAAMRAKAAYHAAACIASNYMVALMDAAMATAELAGLDRRTAWKALSKLVHATLDNIDALGPAAALTGPISRGDAQTVARHVDALGGHGDLLELYRVMGRWTLDVTRRKGTVSPTAAVKLASTLRRARRTPRVAPRS